MAVYTYTLPPIHYHITMNYEPPLMCISFQIHFNYPCTNVCCPHKHNAGQEIRTAAMHLHEILIDRQGIRVSSRQATAEMDKLLITFHGRVIIACARGEQERHTAHNANADIRDGYTFTITSRLENIGRYFWLCA